MMKKLKVYIIPHPTEGFNYYWTCPRGEYIVESGLSQLENVQLVNHPNLADIFILDYVPHNKGIKTTELIDQYNTKKLVVIDWIDEPDQYLCNKYFLYFKRSLVGPITGQVNNQNINIVKKQEIKKRRVYPFWYCYLPEYRYNKKIDKDIDI